LNKLEGRRLCRANANKIPDGTHSHSIVADAIDAAVSLIVQPGESARPFQVISYRAKREDDHARCLPSEAKGHTFESGAPLPSGSSFANARERKLTTDSPPKRRFWRVIGGNSIEALDDMEQRNAAIGRPSRRFA
jgi:hypothetical protein